MKQFVSNITRFFQTAGSLCGWAAVFILIYSCAAIQAPPGGPEDTTPPTLIEVLPPNETIHLSERTIILAFSEYMDEKSMGKSIRVFPRLSPMPELEFLGEKIAIHLPDNLLENQTYILTIGRDLKDEHLVPLDASIQLAFSTGDQIDSGVISGKLYGGSKASVHLWNELSSTSPDSLFFTKPDYLTDIADDGTFSFQYLSPGTYQILAVGPEGSGLPLEPKRMRYGLFWEPNLSLADQDSVSDINMILYQEKPALRIFQGLWTDQQWGHITFNQNLKLKTLLHKGSIELESGDTVFCSVYEHPLDSTLAFILSDSTLALGEKTVVTLFANDKSDPEKTDTAFVHISASDDPDTSWLSLVSPASSFRIAPNDQNGPAAAFVFSRPVQPSERPFDIRLTLSDTIDVPFIEKWINPAVMNISPLDGWSPNSNYKVIILQDTTRLETRETLEDSLIAITVKTVDPIGYGSIVGALDAPWCNPCQAELTPIEKSTFALSEFVNSGTYFEFNHVPEGKYFLQIYHDGDQNKQYTYGTAAPKALPERFFQFPDTISVRKNWEVELHLQSK